MKIGNTELSEADVEFALGKVSAAITSLKQEVAGNLNCKCTDLEFAQALGEFFFMLYMPKEQDSCDDESCECVAEEAPTNSEITEAVESSTNESEDTTEELNSQNE